MAHTPHDSQVSTILCSEDLMNNNPQLIRLMEIGRTKGFQNLIFRKKVWPLILEVNIDKLQESSNFLEWNSVKEEHSSEYDQLKKDAMRSFHSLKPFQNIQEDYLKKKQDELLEILDALSKNEPNYKYFQGFHDIASIFISMFGMNTAYYMSHKLATTYLRDSFLLSFDETVLVLDKLIWEIVVKDDEDFKEIFQDFEKQQLGFTMSWIITWFAHNFEDISIISRIWDYLISSEPSAIVYVSAAFILQSKEKLILYMDEMGGGYDVGIIHSFYQNLKSHNLDIELVLKKSIRLQKDYPLSQLQPSKQIKDSAVMKSQNFVKHFQIHEYLQQLLFKKAQKSRRIKYALIFGATVLMAITVWKRKSIWEWLGVGLGVGLGGEL